jgi:Spy/CpxP family protein refolding chaperone
MCAQDPGSVAKLDEWLKANSTLKGTEVQDAALVAGFEPSFVALAIFPQVIASMAAKLQHTTLVGQLFTADRSAVFASIQKLRAQAQKVGNLKDSPQQNVETKTTSSGEQVIVIEPTNPQIVYVPQYNPTVIYTQPAPATTTVVVEDNSSDAVAAGLIGFTAGIAIGSAMNTPYYYGPMGFYGGAYMYNDAWDDYYDHREDAREDYYDHREDLREERTERGENRQEQRSDRTESRAESGRQATPEQRANAQAKAQERRADGGQAQQRRSGSTEARAGSYSGTAATAQRSGTRSDAFSGYSSGSSTRAASQRGSTSRSSGGGGRSRSGGGGGRRR